MAAITHTCESTTTVSMPLPLGRRSPRGRLRWYLAACEPGREATVCENARRIVGDPALEDAFVLRRERWAKFDGTWSKHLITPFSGYIFMLSRDAGALDAALRGLTFRVNLAGRQDGTYAPLADGAATWLERSLDASRVLRSSTGVIVDGRLHVLEGPLVGQEASVVKVDRHKRTCIVRVGCAEGSFTQVMPLDVPSKS